MYMFTGIRVKSTRKLDRMYSVHCLLAALTWTLTLAAQPNIILIVADDLGWDDVSFHGSEISTPNIDELARNGIVLNNYYVQPICTPTRSAIMTGRHPIHTGLQHGVILAPQPYGLPLNETIMPQFLNELGYTSHIVGKWHLGFFQKEYTPTYRGFKSHFGYWLGHEDYYTHMARSPYFGLDFRRNMDAVRTDNGLYSTELFSSAAESIIRSHNTSQPLFLYLAHQAVHAANGGNSTVEAPQKYVDRFPNIPNKKRRIFAGMVSALDDSVGNVTRSLRETGMMENSIIIFTTDNGGPANGYDGNAACNYPLRGTKNTMWEGGVRGTGLVYSPLLKKTGYVSNHMMHVADWLPTIFKAAGGDPGLFTNIDGYNLWDTLNSKGPDVRTEILHNIDPIQNFSSIRSGDYKLVVGDISNGRDDSWYGCTPPRRPFYSPLKPNRNVFHFDQSDLPINVQCGQKPANASSNCNPRSAPCLFNIANDPCEYRNIAGTNPEIVNALLQRIETYRKTAVPPRNKPSDPRSNPIHFGGVWSSWE